MNVFVTRNCTVGTTLPDPVVYSSVGYTNLLYQLLYIPTGLQSHYRPGVAQGVLGSYGSQIS
jgi:hypothetical protein